MQGQLYTTTKPADTKHAHKLKQDYNNKSVLSEPIYAVMSNKIIAYGYRKYNVKCY